MEIQRLVTGAKLGNHEDFAALVRLYQHRLVATLYALVRDHPLAEDLAQEAFLRAWETLASLRKAEAFPAWLWAIARNLGRTQCQARSREQGQCTEGLDSDAHPDPRSLPGGWESLGVSSWLASLPEQQRRLVELRHGAGLSLRQIGAVLGIPEQRVKSRLFTVRRKLQASLGTWPELPPVFLEEKIMDKIQSWRLAAHVFERLSLAAQTEFARTVLSEQALSEALLAEVGRVDRGSEFLTLYGTKIGLPELIGILNQVDRFTETRLVGHLEVTSPPDAETIKQNMFVFEDLVLLDPSASALLAATSDPDVLAEALGGTAASIRQQILGGFSAEVQADLAGRLTNTDGDLWRVRAAQERIVNDVKDLEQTGRLRVRHSDELGGSVVLSAT
jgi:RNA polymerase sigma factor (sigma-70 family)